MPSANAPSSLARIDGRPFYILERTDKSLYTGITNDLNRRFNQHKKGNGGRYTRAKAREGIRGAAAA
ncbi:MAG TPA: GIY-YIG nuclease family protein [Candidatus Paceibacterota bacterium]